MVARIIRRFRKKRSTTTDPQSVADTEDVKLCLTFSYNFYPRAARNKDGRFVFLVNGIEKVGDFVQKVKVVMCKESMMECGMGEMMSSQRTRCRQSYSQHRLMAVGGGGRLVRDTFTFPSGCYCELI